MVNEELSAALKAYGEAYRQWRYDPARMRGESVPSSYERFLAAVGSERGPDLWAAIRALKAEAERVPDPGGPIKNYIDAISAWEKTHPEVDPRAMGTITNPLVRDHR